MPRPSRLLVLVLLGTAFAGLGAGVTHAAFNKTTTNSGDVITGRPDWLPPTVSATAVAKSTGYSANYVKQGGSYYVYANVAEPASNPAAGVASVTADASALTGGATALALITTGGPWTVEGTTYNYRSALQTAGNPLAAGVKTWSLTATDAATPTTNSTTSPGLTANVDNTAPTASSISAANKTGGTQSRPEQGDTITFTYSEPIDPDSILSGWTGASTNVTVRITNATNDSLAVWDTANTTQLPLGSVNLANGGYRRDQVDDGALGQWHHDHARDADRRHGHHGERGGEHGVDPVGFRLRPRGEREHDDSQDRDRQRPRLLGADQIGMSQSGNQRSSSGSTGSSGPIWALMRSSRSLSRCCSPPDGTNGYQKPRL